MRHPPVLQCWLYGATGTNGAGPWPALILQWRKVDLGWIALVVYVMPDEAYPTAVQTWVEARHLRPVSNPEPAPPI